MNAARRPSVVRLDAQSDEGTDYSFGARRQADDRRLGHGGMAVQDLFDLAGRDSRRRDDHVLEPADDSAAAAVHRAVACRTNRQRSASRRFIRHVEVARIVKYPRPGFRWLSARLATPGRRSVSVLERLSDCEPRPGCRTNRWSLGEHWSGVVIVVDTQRVPAVAPGPVPGRRPPPSISRRQIATRHVGCSIAAMSIAGTRPHTTVVQSDQLKEQTGLEHRHQHEFRAPIERPSTPSRTQPCKTEASAAACRRCRVSTGRPTAGRC